MSEYSDQALKGDAFDYALLMHELISAYNVTNVAHEWGFFGQWERPGANLIEINHNGPPGYEYLGYRLKKIYYAFGQFSRFIPPGSSRIDVATTDPAQQFAKERSLV